MNLFTAVKKPAGILPTRPVNFFCATHGHNELAAARHPKLFFTAGMQGNTALPRHDHPPVVVAYVRVYYSPARVLIHCRSRRNINSAKPRAAAFSKPVKSYSPNNIDGVEKRYCVFISLIHSAWKLGFDRCVALRYRRYL